MKSLKRRDFLKSTISASAFTALSGKKIIGANDKVVMGIMGIGGRGCALLRSLVKRPDVYIKYICDPDTRRYSRAAEIIIEDHGYKPNFVQDFRKMLADPEVDAVVIATSDRWHALGTIMACRSGKDVYVEKPMSLSIADGRKMVEAARKYKRIVQVGTQSRSVPHLEKAVEYIRSGKLGDIHLVRVFHMQIEYGEINKGEIAPVPDGLDYDLWCGPPPMLPYRTASHWFVGLWDFYVGIIMADMTHQMDLARCLIGKTYPDSVCHEGGVYYYNDDREQPDTTFATYKFGDITMLVEGCLWAPYMHRIVLREDMKQYPDYPFCSTKVEICGTEGFMYYGRHGGGWQVYKKKKGIRQNEVAAFGTPIEYAPIVDYHFDNFISCMRSRNKPNADVEEAHLSMLLCHLANISYRTGNRKLKFDGKTETFPDDPEANKYLKANYRKKWIIPDPL